jgi:hypothetical protein
MVFVVQSDRGPVRPVHNLSDAAGAVWESDKDVGCDGDRVVARRARQSVLNRVVDLGPLDARHAGLWQQGLVVRRLSGVPHQTIPFREHEDGGARTRGSLSASNVNLGVAYRQ